MNFVDIVFASLLANNLLFFHFLGLGEVLGEGGTRSAFRRTAALALLLAAAAGAYWVPDHFLLQPFHLEFLRTLLLLAVIWVVTTLWSLVPGSDQGPWPRARELAVHSFLVGGVLLVGSSSPEWTEVLTAALAVSLGYGGALVLVSSVFRRLSRESIPAFLQGLPLQLATFGLIWLVLQGLGFAFVGKAV